MVEALKKYLIVPAAAALAAVLSTVGSAHADVITVTLGWDRFDPGATSECSLREAIQAANTNAPFAGCARSGSSIDDVIVFDSTVSTVTLTRTVSADNDNNEDGDLDVFVGAVSGTLTVRGPVVIQVQDVADRAFDVYADGSGGNHVFALEQVTVTGGEVQLNATAEVFTDKFLCTFSGGALRVNEGVTAVLDGATLTGNSAAYAGGAVCALPNTLLVLSGTLVLSNTAGLSGTTPVDYAWGGGGIWSNGALVMTNSQVLNNRAVLSGSNGHLIGGGGIAVVTGAVSIKDSAISFNQVDQFGEGDFDEGNGGGLLVHRLSAPAPVVLDNVQIEGNLSLGARTAYGGGAALLQGAQATIANQTVISGNVVSATQASFGGGLALGLSYQPADYLASSLDMNNAQVERNLASASIASTPGVITPTVIGGGAFIGERATFTLTQSAIADNAIYYLGTSTINTVGLGGGVEARGSGQIINSQVLRNEAVGFAYIGGGGMRLGGNATVRDSRVEANTATPSSAGGGLGGGVLVDGAAHVRDVIVQENVLNVSQYADGGGIAVNGQLFLTHTVVASNTALQGGGIAVGGGGFLQARAITVTHNRAVGTGYAQGGGLYSNGLALMEQAELAHNQATANVADGGGIAVVAQLFLTHTVVASNTATQGGGIAVGGGALLQARAITVTHNHAVGANFAQGGGLFGGGTAFVEQALVAHNRATAPNYAAGGGVHRYAGVLHLFGSTIRNNQVDSAGGARGGGGSISGTAFLTDTSFVGNVVSATGFVAGGGIAHLGGTLSLVDSEIRSNAARSQDSVAKGGAASLEDDAAMSLLNVQVSDNVARSTSSPAYGGGFDVGPNATLRLTATQVLSNAAIGNNDSGSGGIGTIGTVEVHSSTVRQNAVLSVTTLQPVGGGGGIGNGGRLLIRASSVISNRAGTGAGLNAYGGQTHVLNSTLSGNQAAGASDIGGAILTGTVRITHTTIASNTGQGIAVQGANLVLRAVALAHHPDGNCANWGGSVANSDYSVSTDASCTTFFVGTGALNNAAQVRLAPLAFHVGTATWYHPTLLGSVLHERVPAGDCVARDQLGQPRPGGPNCDTGAFEFQNLRLVYAPIVRRP